MLPEFISYDVQNNSLHGTGKITGIDDLKSGRIVTPLAAKATFLDDPLRVLRAIRFGTCLFLFILCHTFPNSDPSFELCGCCSVTPG